MGPRDLYTLNHYGMSCGSGHGRHAQRRRRPPPCCAWCRFCFLWCVALLVFVLLMLICMCVWSCVACCSVLQRRHNSDAFLKRLRSRHACKLTLNWLGTATRNSSSNESLCGHVRAPWQCRSRLNSKLRQKTKKKTPTSEGLAGP